MEACRHLFTMIPPRLDPSQVNKNLAVSRLGPSFVLGKYPIVEVQKCSNFVHHSFMRHPEAFSIDQGLDRKWCGLLVKIPQEHVLIVCSHTHTCSEDVCCSITFGVAN